MEVNCKSCGNKVVLHATEEQEKFWQTVKNDRDRPHVQHIFPQMPPEEREMLISGICPDCWNKLFS